MEINTIIFVSAKIHNEKTIHVNFTSLSRLLLRRVILISNLEPGPDLLLRRTSSHATSHDTSNGTALYPRMAARRVWPGRNQICGQERVGQENMNKASRRQGGGMLVCLWDWCGIITNDTCTPSSGRIVLASGLIPRPTESDKRTTILACADCRA